MVKGARANNLKNVDVELPPGQSVVLPLANISGSATSAIATTIVEERWIFIDGVNCRYRLTNYRSATLVDSSILGVNYRQIDRVGDTLYAVDSYNGVLRYKIDSNGFGTFLDFLYLPFQAYTVHPVDSSIVIASRNNLLLIADRRTSPPTVTELIVRVSRVSDSTRVGSAANSSGVIATPGSGGSLKAMWPLMPIPPKQASTPPRLAIRLAIRSGCCGSGNTRCSGGGASAASRRS